MVHLSNKIIVIVSKSGYSPEYVKTTVYGNSGKSSYIKYRDEINSCIYNTRFTHRYDGKM